MQSDDYVGLYGYLSGWGLVMNTASGNVGIGTITPQQRLSVSDGMNIDQNNLNSGTLTNTMRFGPGNSGEAIGSKRTTSGNQFGLDFYTASSNRMSITVAGNVGIGTTNPASKLHVFGNGILRVIADSDSNAGFGLSLNNQLKWSVATVNPGHFQIFNQALVSNALWIDNATNNVGIGVTNPGYLLDVGQRMRLRSGGNDNASAGIHFNNNANNVAAFLGMEDDTHIGLFGSSAGWKFGMNTVTGALKVGGNEGQAGQVITSNGAAAAEWKSPTNLLYQRTTMVQDTDVITPLGAILPIPGLLQTVNLSGNAKLLIHFGVFAATTGCVGCVASTAEIYLTVNDAGVAKRLTQTIANDFTREYISDSWLLTLGPGTYAIAVKATSTGPPVTFGCPAGCAFRSNLIVQVIPE